MGLVCNGKLEVRALASRQDAADLAEAAGSRDAVPGADGRAVDLGAPLREAPIVALGGLGSEAGPEAVVAALADFADRVRVAAVRVLYPRGAATAPPSRRLRRPVRLTAAA
jgi:hypothetical protein